MIRILLISILSLDLGLPRFARKDIEGSESRRLLRRFAPRNDIKKGSRNEKGGSFEAAAVFCYN